MPKGLIEMLAVPGLTRAAHSPDPRRRWPSRRSRSSRPRRATDGWPAFQRSGRRRFRESSRASPSRARAARCAVSSRVGGGAPPRRRRSRTPERPARRDRRRASAARGGRRPHRHRRRVRRRSRRRRAVVHAAAGRAREQRATARRCRSSSSTARVSRCTARRRADFGARSGVRPGSDEHVAAVLARLVERGVISDARTATTTCDCPATWTNRRSIARRDCRSSSPSCAKDAARSTRPREARCRTLLDAGRHSRRAALPHALLGRQGVDRRDGAGRARRGWSYIGITDHSQAAFYVGGMTREKILAQHEEIDALNAASTDFRVLKGIEADILADGRLDYDDEIARRVRLRRRLGSLAFAIGQRGDDGARASRARRSAPDDSRPPHGANAARRASPTRSTSTRCSRRPPTSASAVELNADPRRARSRLAPSSRARRRRRDDRDRTGRAFRRRARQRGHRRRHRAQRLARARGDVLNAARASDDVARVRASARRSRQLEPAKSV